MLHIQPHLDNQFGCNGAGCRFHLGHPSVPWRLKQGIPKRGPPCTACRGAVCARVDADSWLHAKTDTVQLTNVYESLYDHRFLRVPGECWRHQESENVWLGLATGFSATTICHSKNTFQTTRLKGASSTKHSPIINQSLTIIHNHSISFPSQSLFFSCHQLQNQNSWRCWR